MTILCIIYLGYTRCKISNIYDLQITRLYKKFLLTCQVWLKLIIESNATQLMKIKAKLLIRSSLFNLLTITEDDVDVHHNHTITSLSHYHSRLSQPTTEWANREEVTLINPMMQI